MRHPHRELVIHANIYNGILYKTTTELQICELVSASDDLNLWRNKLTHLDKK